MRTPQTPVDTNLDGSVEYMDNFVGLDLYDSHVDSSFQNSHPTECDECEQSPAQVTCDDCGLVYCANCDAHKHRKGKLQLHQRVQIARKRIKAPELEEVEEEAEDVIVTWKTCDVCDWLEAHDLELFAEEAQRQKLTGVDLLAANGLDRILHAATGASRGHKKKLQREVHKLQNSVKRSPFQNTTLPEPAPSPPIDSAKNSMRQLQGRLRVDVESVANEEPRRRAPGLNPVGSGPLKIDMNEDNRVATIAPEQGKNGRQLLCGLELDIAQVIKEEKTVAASFDFSATGRLQTQGFEINVRASFNLLFDTCLICV